MAGGRVSEAVGLSSTCRWVTGGGKAHDPSHEGPVDTVFLGCWRREAFQRFGLFDETLVRAQDSEFNFRILLLGGKIWQTPRICSWYQPRKSVTRLFRQYGQYGYWKVATLKKHASPHPCVSSFQVRSYSRYLRCSSLACSLPPRFGFCFFCSQPISQPASSARQDSAASTAAGTCFPIYPPSSPLITSDSAAATSAAPSTS